MTEKQAKALRSVLVQGGESLSDAVISTAPEACQRMQYNGELISNGTRINWNGTVKRAAVDLWDTEENNPDNAPTLWEDLMYRNGIRIIPNPITVGLKFSKDELGWWGNTLYRSKVDNNVYTPEEYPDNWEIVKKG